MGCLPTKWDESYVTFVYQLALLGAMDVHIAQFFNISVDTLNQWKNEHPEFFESLSKGKQKADMEVAESFYLNCIDRFVEVEEAHVVKGKLEIIKVKRFIQGDKWAQSKWLCLRQSDVWSETHKFKYDITKTNLNLNMDLSGLEFKDMELMEKVLQKQIPQNAGINE